MEGCNVYLIAIGLAVAAESNLEAGRRIRDIFLCGFREYLVSRISLDEVVARKVGAPRFLSYKQLSSCWVMR